MYAFINEMSSFSLVDTGNKSLLKFNGFSSTEVLCLTIETLWSFVRLFKEQLNFGVNRLVQNIKLRHNGF